MSDSQPQVQSIGNDNMDPPLAVDESESSKPKTKPAISFGTEDVLIEDDVASPPPSEMIPNISVPDEKANLRSRTKKADYKKAESVSSSIIKRQMALVTTGDDEDGEGEISDEKLRLFIRNVIKEKRRAEDTRKWLYAALFALLLLCTANIGTAYLAVYLAKDTKIQNSDFVSKATGERVGVNGMGEMLNVDMIASERYLNEKENEDAIIDGRTLARSFCVKEADFAKVWYKAMDGSAVGININYPDEENKQEGIELKWHGSWVSNRSACFNTPDEGRNFCAVFDDNRCLDDGDKRRLSPAITSREKGTLASIRVEIFKKHIEAFKNDEKFDESSFWNSKMKDFQDKESDGKKSHLRKLAGEPCPFAQNTVSMNEYA